MSKRLACKCPEAWEKNDDKKQSVGAHHKKDKRDQQHNPQQDQGLKDQHKRSSFFM
jgi:hypothetical protein